MPTDESAFEYDGEDTEADEAMFEADGEADEGIDEADGEADEALFEADGEADEADMEADGEADGEADEAIDEEEGISLSDRLRMTRAENQRAAFARKVSAGLTADAQRAAATRRDLADRLRSIQRGGRAQIYSVGRLRGAGVVTATLPNGRSTRMRIMPVMAPVGEVNQLRAAINVNERRQAAATASNSRAIASLSATQTAAVKKLSAQQVMSDRELGKRLIEVNQRLDKRITGALTNHKGAIEQNNKKILRALKRQRTRALWNSLLLASSAPLYAAYGDRDNPFSKNNLILTGSLIGFMVGDELIDSYGKGSKSGLASRGANAWSYLAPAANFGLNYFLLNDKIHDRFVAGVAPSVIAAGTTVKLTIPAGSADDFKNDVANRAVVATIVSVSDTGGAALPTAPIVTTKLDGDGNLTLTLSGTGVLASTSAKVAWMVEIQKPTN